MRIEGEEVFGFVDHDYEKIKNFSIKGRIKWFEYRYKKILFFPLKNIKIITSNKKTSYLLESDNTSINTIVLMAICVGIDLLAGFFAGAERDTNRKDFVSFVNRNLDQKREYLKCRYENIDKFSELLYFKFRCGLAHNLAIKKVGFTYGSKYFVFDKKKQAYYVSLDRLFGDLRRAFNKYIADLENKKSLKIKFNKRFNHIFINRL
jgi:hypothetical protein